MWVVVVVVVVVFGGGGGGGGGGIDIATGNHASSILTPSPSNLPCRIHVEVITRKKDAPPPPVARAAKEAKVRRSTQH